ncbi:MAG: TIGR01459 family HAD-type hydrolase [Rickettsiales bacterium]|nr:MAG: TIGR01459 family HAD-type hydrolase [Rickettsiales bacterium]
MSQLTYKPLKNVIDNYDLFLIDLWGVIVEGEYLYPSVIESINEIIAKKKVIFLTNAPRPNYVLTKKLESWGLNNITADKIISSGDVARQLIKDHQATKNTKVKIFHLGQDRNEDILLDMDYELVTNIEQADIFLLSLYRDDHENIDEFNQLLEKAAKLPNLYNICSNPDVTIPYQNTVRYCSGYFANIIEQHNGKVFYTGKPKTLIYDRVFELHQTTPKNRILMIGDTFETDILGANDSGIHSGLVLTGNSAKIHGLHTTLDDKLIALSNHVKKVNMTPTFITSFT